MNVAVFGGGYAGVTLVRGLERRLGDDVTVVLVDETGEHLVQHELHRVIRRPSITDEIVLDLREITETTSVRRATVESIDPEAGVARLEDGTLEYDIGAVCLGAEPAYYGLPGVEEHATPLKSVSHAHTIRRKYLDVLDAGDGRVVVGGAGLSGIQVAGELAALAREEGVAAGEDVELVLLEQASSVAPGFDESFQSAVRDQLERRGVDVRTGHAVAEATDETISFETGDELPYDQFVWTGGIRGPDAMAGERSTVDGRLELADRTFLLGDSARVADVDGEAVPASAQAAVRQARTVANNVERLVEYERDGGTFEPRLQQFDFDSPGWLVSIGDGAVAQVGPTIFTGRTAVALKTTVGVGYLTAIGGIRDAVDLVNDELGLTVED
jgi:NADH dehydrogenase